MHGLHPEIKSMWMRSTKQAIQYALEKKLKKSKFGFERTAVSNFKSKRHVGSGNEIVDYSDPELRVLVLSKMHVGSVTRLNASFPGAASSTGWPSRSQSLRYPCPAEREKR